MNMAPEFNPPQEAFRTTQERVYFQVRDAILRGKFLPGHPITIRGLAAELNCSPMPVREALRRLTSERALELSDTRRVTVPTMTPEKLAEICAARVALECQAAEQALPFVGQGLSSSCVSWMPVSLARSKRRILRNM